MQIKAAPMGGKPPEPVHQIEERPWSQISKTCEVPTVPDASRICLSLIAWRSNRPVVSTAEFPQLVSSSRAGSCPGSTLAVTDAWEPHWPRKV